MTVQRRFDFFGNWKMAQTLSSCAEFLNAWKLESNNHRRIAFCASYTHLPACLTEAAKQKLKVSWGGQDCSSESKGAFTAEISAAMLKELGCEFTLVGHSERRQRGHETNQSLRKKLDQAFEAGLIPVFCVGETEAHRDAGRVFEILDEQTEIVLSEKRPFLIAYEPVWAIGTGRTASTKDIHEAHAHLWKRVPQTQSVLYGGSVKPENAREILSIESVTGLLVGGASLKAADFAKIVEAV